MERRGQIWPTAIRPQAREGKQKGKYGIKHEGRPWVGTPIDEAKVDLSLSVLQPLPLVRLLKYMLYPPPLHSHQGEEYFLLHSCSCRRVLWAKCSKYIWLGALVPSVQPGENHRNLALTLPVFRIEKCPVAQVP